MITLTAQRLIEFLQEFTPTEEVKLLGIMLALPEGKEIAPEVEMTNDGRPKTLGIAVEETIAIKDIVR